jgi:peptide/nickel transport system permease protein
MKKKQVNGYWQGVWKKFSTHRLGIGALLIVIVFCVVGIYAPFFASSQPLIVYFDDHLYFPFFRYLFYRGFFTKQLDLFYNLLMFTLPLFILLWILTKFHPFQRKLILFLIPVLHLMIFIYLLYRVPVNPAASPLFTQYLQKQFQIQLEKGNQQRIFSSSLLPNWNKELSYLSSYAKLNLVIHYQQRKKYHEKLVIYEQIYEEQAKKKGEVDLTIPSIWHLNEKNRETQRKIAKDVLKQNGQTYPRAKAFLIATNQTCLFHSKTWKDVFFWDICQALISLSKKDEKSILNAKKTVRDYEQAEAELNYLKDKQEWLEKQSSQLRIILTPFIRPFHWEEDAGGSQALNRYISWWDLSRINRKDMIASLIFGIRISLSVGLLSVALSLIIAIPIGALSGFYGGKVDLITYRLIEIWESMPTFFMLLMIIAFFQSKSIFLVISIIGFFGWTGFSRFIRGEFLKQKELPYVEACRSIGFNNRYIMFSHLLPNAIPPILTLVPFAIMGAITSEAGLSFLGLGEEGSCSWGVLMDEGRTAFPAEGYLLWPPAILLTILLVSIALVGDSLRDVLDPKMH